MAVCSILQSSALRFIAICLLLFTVGSAARDHGPCKFIRKPISLSCPCTMSWSQILRLHNLGQFQDNCTRGRGNELRCQIAREARVEAGGVTLNYTRGIPGTVFYEIYNNTSGSESPRQETVADGTPTSPPVTNSETVSSSTKSSKRAEMWDINVLMGIRVTVGLCVPVAVLLFLCRIQDPWHLYILRSSTARQRKIQTVETGPTGLDDNICPAITKRLGPKKMNA
ncbi:uncharacterized protein [Hemitrygon akajei]|uniref:uncharacterized protein n=1 Tax=Hemitrygon akajei TaxID=2704970 RepID=UPI003BF98D94